MENPLKAYRGRLGVTLTELALILNVNYAQLSGVEIGRVAPSAPLLLALAAEGEDVAEFTRAWYTWRAEIRAQKKAEVAKRAAPRMVV